MKKNYFIFFLCLMHIAFAGYVEVLDQSKLETLTPSLQDRKSAKIRLSNGLNVYLISDPKSDQSAAALAVEAGSWQDPVEYPGMAHFLEHMLFMGTKPYPDENAFFQYVGDYAGKFNAYTASDRTVYMFAVNHDGFEGALDRFSHFFIDPLFNPKGVNRELFIVDQEHTKNIENDDWRLYMVSKEIGNPNHPNAKFSTGNSQTLSKIPQSALRNWYDKHYSANLMHLVIYSSKSIEELKALIVEKFSPVPNRGAEPFSTKERLSTDAQKETIVYVKPIRKTQKIYIEWELPKSFANDSSKSAELLAYTIRRGQRYSLEQTLRSAGLIEELSVDCERIGHHHCLFQIAAELTEKGIQDVEDVLKQCFAAIEEIRVSKIPSYLFQEMQEVNTLNYQYQQRVDAFDFVQAHAHSLMDEPLSTYPQHTVLATKFDSKKMQQLTSYLKPKNAHLYVIASQEKINVLLDQKEKWMGCEYTCKALTSKELTSLKQTNKNFSTRIAPPNPFLPNHLEILPLPDTSQDVLVLADDDHGKVFYLRDTEFLTPESSLHIHLLSPFLDESVKANVLSRLFLEHAKQKLDPLITCASEANINLSLANARHRIHFTIEGFSEKIPLFVEEVFKEITHSYPSKQEFYTIKSRLQKSYENASKELPVSQALDSLKSALSSDEFTSHARLSSLQKITYDDYLEFQNKLFRKTYLEGFFAGNLSLKDAESIYSDLRHFLGAHSYPVHEHKQRKIFSISANSGPFLIQEQTKALGNGIVLTIDQGSFSFEKRGAQEILGQVIQDSFFDTLRTKQKTAYIAKAWPVELERRLFQNFAVQSSTHEPMDLLYRFELFLEDFISHFPEKITEERFNTIKENQIHKLNTSLKNLSIKSATLDKLAFEYGDLKWIDKRVEGLKNLSFEEFQAYTISTLSKENRKRLAVLVNGMPNEQAFIYEKITTQDFENFGEYTESGVITRSK